MKKFEPYRFSIDLNQLESQKFAIVKLGFFWNNLRGIWEFWRYSELIKKQAGNWADSGLLHTEFFLYSGKHAGLMQYWRSFEDLEKWACKHEDHVNWWKEMEAQNKWEHMSMYHEVYLVDKCDVEAIYNFPKGFKKEDFPSMASFLPHTTPAKFRARERFLKEPK